MKSSSIEAAAAGGACVGGGAGCIGLFVDRREVDVRIPLAKGLGDPGQHVGGVVEVGNDPRIGHGEPGTVGFPTVRAAGGQVGEVEARLEAAVGPQHQRVVRLVDEEQV